MRYLLALPLLLALTACRAPRTPTTAAAPETGPRLSHSWAMAPGGEELGTAPVPPGEHPRVIFDKRQIGVMRRRAATPEGEAMLGMLRHYVFGAGEAWVRKLTERDEKWLAERRAGARSVLSDFTQQVYQAALLYTLTGDAKDGLIATEYFRLWLDGWPPDEEIEPHQSWGNPWIALTYDWLYGLLTDAEQERGRLILASMVGEPTMAMIGKDWWFAGPSICNRNVTNWTAICSASLGTTNLVLEGHEGFNPELLGQCIAFQREFLQGGISPNGALFEGMGYATGYGTKDVPYFLTALERRGVDLRPQTNLPKMVEWMTYETLPWGYESLPLNQCNGDYGCGNLLTYLCSKQGGLARWIYHNVTGPAPKLGCDAAMATVHGLPAYRGERPDALPLSRWFSVRGLVLCRSGWGPRDTLFAFNTNAVGAGHTHADQGHFCLVGNGAGFLVEPGVTFFSSTDHNVVHVDGKGQAQAQSSVDSFLRSADLGGYADIMDADVKLAYDRKLVGPGTGPWHWQEYNPVRHADRRALFVRGATGPLAIVTDDLAKDDVERLYEWYGQIPRNMVVTTSGNTFRIAERWGGKVLDHTTAGGTSTYHRDQVRPGTVRGWLLVRSTNTTTGWSSNPVDVNGVRCPYNTTYWGRGQYWRGWSWMAMLPAGKPEIELKEGAPLEVKLTRNTGGRAACVVFTYRTDWEPTDDPPADGGDFIVLTPADVVQGDDPWDVLDLPKGVCDGVFLGAEALALDVRPNPRTRMKVLRAGRRGTAARFAALLVPHDDADGRTLAATGQTATVTGPGGTDLVAAATDSAPTAGRLATDADAAVVSFDSAGKCLGYTVLAGAALTVDGQPWLTVGGGRVHVVNDGTRLLVRGPGGAVVACHRLGAREVIVNGRPVRADLQDTVRLTIPALPGEWQVTIGADGTRVDVVGDGPQPLKIAAPRAVNCTVNGVDRWFLRDREGNIFPLLEAGSPYEYQGELPAAELVERCASPAAMADARVLDPAGRPGQALVPAGNDLRLSVPLAGPGVYRVVFSLVARDPMALEVRFDDAEPTFLELAAGRNRLALDNVPLNGTATELVLAAAAPWGLLAIMPQPQHAPIPPTAWISNAPWPSDYLTRTDDRTGAVKDALARKFPPERTVDPAAVLVTAAGEERAWLGPDAEADRGRLSGVHFSRRHGFKNSDIGYAATVIESPTDRPAELRIGCDYWAQAWLNGKPVRSVRPEDQVAADGAQFNAENPTAARIRLKRGANLLFVKVHGGTGGNSFIADISDPGDLEFHPPTK